MICSSVRPSFSFNTNPNWQLWISLNCYHILDRCLCQFTSHRRTPKPERRGVMCEQLNNSTRAAVLKQSKLLGHEGGCCLAFSLLKVYWILKFNISPITHWRVFSLRASDVASYLLVFSTSSPPWSAFWSRVHHQYKWRFMSKCTVQWDVLALVKNAQTQLNEILLSAGVAVICTATTPILIINVCVIRGLFGVNCHVRSLKSKYLFMFGFVMCMSPPHLQRKHICFNAQDVDMIYYGCALCVHQHMFYICTYICICFFHMCLLHPLGCHALTQRSLLYAQSHESGLWEQAQLLSSLSHAFTLIPSCVPPFHPWWWGGAVWWTPPWKNSHTHVWGSPNPEKKEVRVFYVFTVCLNVWLMRTLLLAVLLASLITALVLLFIVFCHWWLS